MTDPVEPETNTWKEQIQEALAIANPALRRAAIARLRARAVRWFFNRHPGLIDGRLVITVGDQQVVFTRMEVNQVEGGQYCLDVWVDDPASNDPHFRLFNPPLNVRRQTITWEDPITAVAEVVAGNGGARQGKRQVRR